MKTAVKQNVSKDELIHYLETLTSQLRAGVVQVAGQSWQVPESLEIKRAVKEKKGTLRYKLEWQWPTLSDYDESAQREVAQWQNSFKQVKKDLAMAFKQLKQSVSQGVLPAKQAMEDFAAHAQAFMNLAEPEWTESAQEFMEHFENLNRSLALQQMESVVHELNDLQNRMKACHREFG